MWKQIIYLAIFILSISFCYSAISGKIPFSNGLYAENISFSSNFPSTTRYFNIDNNNYILNMSMKVLSFGYGNLTYQLNNIYAFNQTSGNLIDFGDHSNSTGTNIWNKTAIGINGNAWNFTKINKSYVNMSTTSNTNKLLNNRYNFTINAWVKPEAPYLGGILYIYDGKRVAGGETAIFYSEGKLYSRVTTNNEVEDSIDSNTVFSTNKWYMVTQVYNGSHQILYINGTNKGQSTVTGFVDTGQALAIGSQYSRANHYWDGLIDEFYIWNRSLKQEEIAYLYNNGTGKFFPFENITGAFADVTVKFMGKNYNVNTLTQTKIIFNNTVLLKNISNCNCINCTLTDGICKYPISFFSLDKRVQFYNMSIDYQKQIFLIDEKDNTAFNVNNLTAARLYWNNNSYFDFKAANTNFTNFSLYNNKLRIELTYEDGTIINRYIDTDLVEKDFMVCANKQGITHYEQLIQSSKKRPAILNSIYADCLVTADYTRFGYQTDYLLKAYTIDTDYELITYDGTTPVNLIGVDGSIQAYINLDTIEISQTPYEFSILDDYLNFERVGDTSIKIYYKNLKAPNSDLSLSIIRLDTNAVIYTKDDFTNNDEFTIIYDYTSETGINSTTIFMADVTKTNAAGTSTIKRYFNNLAKSGIIPAAIAITIAFLLTIFGLSFTISRLSFSYFGIFANIIAITILTFSMSAWYITFMFAIEFIVIIFQVIIMMQKNYSTIAT